MALVLSATKTDKSTEIAIKVAIYECWLQCRARKEHASILDTVRFFISIGINKEQVRHYAPELHAKLDISEKDVNGIDAAAKNAGADNPADAAKDPDADNPADANNPADIINGGLKLQDDLDQQERHIVDLVRRQFYPDQFNAILNSIFKNWVIAIQSGNIDNDDYKFTMNFLKN